MLIKEISEIAEEVGFDNVDPVGITEVSESHSQPLSNKELYELAQQLTKRKKEDENEKDLGTKEMHTDILSSVDMAAEKLCDIDPDCERSSTVKRGIRAMLHPYYEILQEKKKKSKQFKVTYLLGCSEPRPGPSSAK